MTTKSTVSRRTFLAAAGAVAATAAVAAPVLPTLAGAASSSRLPPRSAFLEGLRALYRVEIEALAESLRPRFEAGELRAFVDVDLDLDDPHSDGPHGQIEAACAEHFGLKVEKIPHEWRTEGPRVHRGDMSAAFLVLAASPHAESTSDGYHHPCYHAQAAAAWDVIALARVRGWYTPTADECTDPAQGEVLS